MVVVVVVVIIIFVIVVEILASGSSLSRKLQGFQMGHEQEGEQWV